MPLFHPRRSQWSAHFVLRGEFIIPLTPIGRLTVRLLHLNAPERVEEWEMQSGSVVAPWPEE
jgi:hypothetical protein